MRALERSECLTHAGRKFWRGLLLGQPVVLALSGIGKVAAATTATVLVERLGAERVVFTGVAGGVGDGVWVGDVVVATDYLQHDMDASPLFPRWQVPGYPQLRMACDAPLTAMLLEASRAVLAGGGADLLLNYGGPAMSRAPQVHAGLIASGDQFVSTGEASSALREALRSAGHDVLAVEMEGAAVAQVCADYGVPFAAMRTISDRADDNAHVDFPRFVQTVASRYAQQTLRHFLALQKV